MRPEPYDEMKDNEATDIQPHLKGVWTSPLGCPHIHLDDIDRCDANEMRPCVYERGKEASCDIFREIINEWWPDVCPECGQHRPDDERVRTGMKCGICAY